jgi:transcriptional regulator with XRE-family HTH domain
MGNALREGRLALSLRQNDVAERAGVSQAWVSRMERGSGRTASLETWASMAIASGSQLASFLEELPGASRPRDYEHLKRQQLVLDTSRPGGWTGRVEARLDPWPRSRSVDVLLERGNPAEIAVTEIWDFFDDVGESWRSLDGKIATLRTERPAATVAGLFIVRGTRRNRELVREFASIFRERFPGSSVAWLRALTTTAPMPHESGLLWTDVRGTRLIPARRLHGER